MDVITKRLQFNTKGAGDLLDITASIQEVLDRLNIEQGLVNVFVVGSTAAITTFEYENGLIKDMKQLYERIAPKNKSYAHDETWNDANGFSHVRAAMQGPMVTIPFQSIKLLIGTWQQIVLAEFDTRPRQREIILTFIGK